MKKAKVILKANIEKEINDISGNLDDHSVSRYQALKKKLDDIIEHEISGSILRSLCRDYEEGEKCNEYFFSLEKIRNKQKTISCLKS